MVRHFLPKSGFVGRHRRGGVPHPTRSVRGAPPRRRSFPGGSRVPQHECGHPRLERRDGARELGFQYGIAVAFDGKPLFEQPVWKAMFQGPGDFAVADRRDKMPRWHEIVR